MDLQPREHLTEKVTIRARPSQIRKLDMAARLAGVSRSRLLREGGLEAAREVIRNETEDAEES